jgi:hypothetical protein
MFVYFSVLKYIFFRIKQKTNHKVDQNVVTPKNTDIYLTATNVSDCCNKCSFVSDCLGFSFYKISSNSGGCWLKSYDPLGEETPAPKAYYPGMTLGSLDTTISSI